MSLQKHITIIGAGIAGIETAVQLAANGHRITVVEKEKNTGGKLNNWHHLFPDFSDPKPIIDKLNSNFESKNIKLITDTEITEIEKNNNRFIIKAGNELSLTADAVVIASGFKIFDATRKEEYGYGLFDNVITSVDLEQQLNKHNKITTAQGTEPKRIAIVHCVGSRDAKCGNTYCSKVCCVTAVKQAIELNKLMPGCQIFCFYMDLRMYGSKFDDLYLDAQKQHNIQFIRGRLSEAAEKLDSSLQIKAEDTLSGRPLRMDVDMLVLMVGMEPGQTHQNFAKNSQIELDSNGFFKSENVHFARNYTTQKGVFMAGTCICPMTVNETIENARSAATEVNAFLKTI